jgi:hypothetical protein
MAKDDYQCIGHWGSHFPEGDLYQSFDKIISDSKGNIYVTDNVTLKIAKFSSNGKYLKNWEFINGDGNIFCDQYDNIWLQDCEDFCIFNSEGQIIDKWKEPKCEMDDLGSMTSNTGFFGVVVDKQGCYYIRAQRQYDENRSLHPEYIYKFSPQKKFISEFKVKNPSLRWRGFVIDVKGFFYLISGEKIFKYTPEGELKNCFYTHFSNIISITNDVYDNLYITDSHRITKISQQGKIISESEPWSDGHQSPFLTNISVSPNGENLFVVDRRRPIIIQKFQKRPPSLLKRLFG